ncbi:YqaJ viral recombinase family protein [Candidatus Phytoplasma asiaticum]|uniref:YqaJ viral recombinase family protein n=1 Tax=Candidatus Phytoplasma asiaticum TaxID=2763338 RepID=A0AAX3B9V3_9MOLU|nr:YqaJ viral recombinase family protein ['Parthenium hysterophorus' phyllody phytoplasma]
MLTEKTQETKKKKRASASKKTLEENTQETKKKKKASSPEKSDYHVSASEVASITGHDSYRSMKQLVVDKLFGTNFTANQYTLHGQKMEPIARKFFNDKNDLTFEKVSFYNEEFKLFAALDGYNEEKKAVLEIKCPFMDKDQKVSNTWDSFLKDPQPENIPKNYWAQVQCQLFCSKAKLAYFLVYFNEEKYYVVDVYPDNAFISKMIEDSQNYLEFLKNCVEELENTTYLKQLKKLSKKSKLKSNN